MGDTRNVEIILVKKGVGKRKTGKPRLNWENRAKIK
jgi:hypothetical protein